MKEALDFNQLKQNKFREGSKSLIWRRLFALTIDFFVLYVIGYFLNFYSFLIYTLIGLLYKPLTEYFYQGTPGKIMMGLKVVDESNQRPKLSRCLLRSIFFYLIYSFHILRLFYGKWMLHEIQLFGIWLKSYVDFTPLPYCLSSLFSLFNENNQALHDRIAKTYVIMEAK